MPFTSYLEWEKQLSPWLCPQLTYSNDLSLRWSKALEQRIIIEWVLCSMLETGALSEQAQSWERALESCKVATFKGWTWKQRKKHLRTEDFLPEKGSTSSPSHHHCSHKDVCVCACVYPTEGQKVSHKHYGPRALKYPCKPPVVHVTPPSMKWQTVNFVCIVNATLCNSLFLQKASPD